MRNYVTNDYSPDLTADEMSYAPLLTTTKASDNTYGWDNVATIEGRGYTPISPPESFLADLIYSFYANEGATYDIFSTSYYDPYLEIYDQYGNSIEMNNEANDTAGIGLDGDVTDYLSWVAPYTGLYYVDPAWASDFSSNRFYSLSIHEDVDTITTAETIEAQAGRIFNWTEYHNGYPFHHTESQIISDYYARLYYAPTYSDGTNLYGLGEKDGNIYFYNSTVPDGTDPISLLGTVSDLLTQAMAEGF